MFSFFLSEQFLKNPFFISTSSEVDPALDIDVQIQNDNPISSTISENNSSVVPKEIPPLDALINEFQNDVDAQSRIYKSKGSREVAFVCMFF